MERVYRVYQERFQYPLLIAIVFFILELFVPLRKKIINVTKKNVPLLIIFMVIFPYSILAAETTTGSWTVYNENEKGLKAYEAKKLPEAKKHFGKAQAIAPETTELQYNLGMVECGSGRWDDAARAFRKSGDVALKQGNADLATRSYYNLGNVYSAKGDIKEAARAYLQTIELAKQNNDKQLEEMARKNLELLVKQKQQKKNKSDKEKEDEKSKQEKEKKDKEESESQDKQEQNKEKDSQDKQDQKAKDNFKSKQMTKEDAKRVMEKLSEIEKRLQSKLKKQKGRRVPREKDW